MLLEKKGTRMHHSFPEITEIHKVVAPTDFEVRQAQLERSFPDGAYIKIIKAVHGFEPSIMGVNIGRHINDELERHGLSGKPIILPEVYKDRLPDILRDEFPNYQHMIFLSQDSGRILRKTSYTDAGYPTHLHEVVLYQSEVQKELREMMGAPFSAVSLDGKTTITIEPGQKRIEINTGANVTAVEVGEKRAHSVFPVRFSDLIRLVKSVPEIKKHYDEAELEVLLKKALTLEEHMLTTQLPDPHTVETFDWFTGDGVILTPPLKEKRTPPSDLPLDKPAIYVNVSGNDAAYAITRNFAEEMHRQGFAIFAPPRLQWDFRIPTNARSLYAVNDRGESIVEFVLARSGGGTIWDAMIAGIPMIYLAYFPYDNPEIFGNNRTLEANGLGVEFAPNMQLLQKARDLRETIPGHNRRFYRDHTISGDISGLTYVAHNIIEAEIFAS